MTVTNRKIDGKILYFEIGPSGVQVEIDKKEYDKKLGKQIKDFKSSQKKAGGGTVKKSNFVARRMTLGSIPKIIDESKIIEIPTPSFVSRRMQFKKKSK